MRFIAGSSEAALEKMYQKFHTGDELNKAEFDQLYADLMIWTICKEILST